MQAGKFVTVRLCQRLQPQALGLFGPLCVLATANLVALQVLGQRQGVELERLGRVRRAMASLSRWRCARR